MIPRPYQNLNDLERMQELLRAGRLANTGGYYVHPGDLSWWLFYTEPEEDLRPYITLWESDSGELIGWTLLSPPKQATIDIFVKPELYGNSAMRQLFQWSADRMVEVTRAQGGESVRKFWNFASDRITADILEGLGFAPKEDETLIYFTRQLDELLAEPVMPPGSQVRRVSGEAELEWRAMAQRAAFGSRLPFERYVERYRRFMHSPVYATAGDLAIVAPEGGCAGFCITWPDEACRVGLFEPVGVHPAYQRQGYGKAVMQAGLQYLQAQGMETAIVCAAIDNPAAIQLYRAVGFVETDRLETYQKRF